MCVRVCVCVCDGERESLEFHSIRNIHSPISKHRAELVDFGLLQGAAGAVRVQAKWFPGSCISLGA